MGIAGCLLGFLVVIYFCYKEWSVYLATFLGAYIVILLTGVPFLEALTTTYIDGVYTAVKSFFFLMLFGCLLSRIYMESGAAYSISDTIMSKLLKPNQSQTAKNLIGMSVILVIGFILNMGGIMAGVVIVLMYPIALAIFERCGIPKRFILGVLGAGSYTFTLSIPGSPQVTNVAAMTCLGTSASVAVIPGIVGAVVEIAVILLLMNAVINRAIRNGEVFSLHALDPKYDRDSGRPGFIVSVLPMAALFIVFNAFAVDIVLCLIGSCLLSLLLFSRHLELKYLKTMLSRGATDSVPMTMTVGAICGFAAVVTNTDAFQQILGGILSIDIHPILICWIVVALMCMLTGGSSTGQLIALPQIAPKLMEMGLNVGAVHRVSVFAATTLDSMPYCGSILMLLPMCHMELKEVYPPMFITTVIATTCGTAAVSLMCIMFPGLA